MVKYKCIDFIKALETKETEAIIGKIDTKFLNSKVVETLCYSFPLIERLVLEIYKLIPDADVEYYEQGINRTILSIIEGNKDIEVIPELIIKQLKKYYDKNGLRNEIFHPNGETITIEVNFEEINNIIMHLLSVLKELLKENTEYDFKDIEYL